MNYLEYISTAYAVFVIVVLWNSIAPWIATRRKINTIKLCLRESSPKSPPNILINRNNEPYSKIPPSAD